MVIWSDVVLAYKLFLHREPESEAVVRSYMQMANLEALLSAFISSDEFRAKMGRSQTPLSWPLLAVETAAPPETELALLAHVQATWRHLGKTEPHWSVLSVPQFRPDQLEQNRDSFRESGRADVAILQKFLERSGLSPVDFHTCFELGCGVGRLTRWLAELFPAVIAADVSDAHLAVLRSENPAPHVQTTLLEGPATIGTLPEYDLFFSLIVLQHNPPPMIRLWLQACLAKLRPGGIGYFQLPTYSEGYAFHADRYLAALPSAQEMEMHVLPQPEVFATIANSFCDVLEVREDGYTGDTRGVSNTFLVRKRSVS